MPDKLEFCRRLLDRHFPDIAVTKAQIAKALDDADPRTGSRTAMPLSPEVLLKDLEFVLTTLNRRKLTWTALRIWSALALVCEARRHRHATDSCKSVFFASDAVLGRLIGCPDAETGQSLAPLLLSPRSPANRLHLCRIEDRGNRIRARRLKACRTLQDHLRAHPTPNGCMESLGDTGLPTALYGAVVGNAEPILVDGQAARLTPADSDKIEVRLGRQVVVLKVRELALTPTLVTAKPYSWTKPWKAGSPTLASELELV
ncbi:MAG: hypothetical protein HZB39_12150, partial [Planctomycetes bacterium]|nr:hypothetical protein [Planctomycetota bacterium]